MIANIPNMYHYDASNQCRVKCDASHRGLGAALEQTQNETYGYQLPSLQGFHFQPQIEFRTQTNIVQKNVFCMQNLIFCVHNVVLDTIKLAFIFFSLNFFFKTLRIPISFVWGVNVCLDQCLII